MGRDDVSTTAPPTTVEGSATSVAPTTAFQPTTVAGATITGATPCPNADGSSPRTITFEQAPPTCIDPAKTYTAKVSTNKGDFTMALDATKAPLAVNNFVVLSRYHYFDGVLCHRIIESFVVQCGDPTGTGAGPNPGYTFADELPQAGEYKVGSVAMANSGPDTNGSQFFIITGDEGVALPASYSLFGQVGDGMETTVRSMEAAAGPPGSGVPTSEPIYITSVTITES
jgi:peptidylprolyl isomerase/peptidyl-prolyl cis-trans isomerase B (cyclophilin B)